MKIPPMDHVLEAKKKTMECIEIAAKHFGRSFLISEVSFDLRGTSAGQLQIRQKEGIYRIRYNRVLLEENPETVIGNTVPHEVSHLVAYQVYGRKISQHGAEWKSVMSDVFGLKPNRCHQMDVSAVAPRPYIYGCLCNREIRVTKRHHRKIQKSDGYSCRVCKASIMFTREEVVSISAPVADTLLVSSLGSVLTRKHIDKIKSMLGTTVVGRAIMHGDAATEECAATFAKMIAMPAGSVEIHRRRETIPDNLTHALFFNDNPTARQLQALERLRENEARVRLLRHP